jgi:tripartite-type tricarboxylate transporter receptor subunit TctC
LTVSRRTLLATLAATPFAALASRPAFAAYPDRPIRLIVPFAPGGNADLVGRLLAESMAGPLGGANMVVENRAGAGGSLGASVVAQAAPDGYTLLIAAIAPLGIVPHVRKVPYVVDRDLAPVGIIATQPHLLLVNPDKMPVRTLPEFIKLLQDNPGKYNYASSGAGQLNQLEMELLMLKTGTKMTHIPYKSSGDQATALIGGHVETAVFGITAALPYIQGGKVRPIAVMTAERYPELPDLPAVRELIPSFGGVFSWHGLMVPAGTPKPIVDKLYGAIAQAVAAPEVKEKLKAIGSEVMPMASPDAFPPFLKSELDRWGEVVRAAGLERK